MREATHLPFRAGYNWVLTAMVGALKKPVGSTSCGCAAIFMRNRAVDLGQNIPMDQDIVSDQKNNWYFLKFTIDFLASSRYNVLLHEEKMYLTSTLLEEV